MRFLVWGLQVIEQRFCKLSQVCYSRMAVEKRTKQQFRRISVRSSNGDSTHKE